MIKKFTIPQKILNKYFVRLMNIMLMTFILEGCTATQPKNTSNICQIFHEKTSWYDSASDMKDKWGVPIHVPMAMMYQESSFKADAVPPKNYVFFGLIPWGRISSAYGYSQAKTPTWADYVRETRNSGADRDDFHDALDFMGWFISKTYSVNGISKWDAYAQYLNYHEGWGGFRRKTYNQKQWLIKVAKKVHARSLQYATQLKTCEADLQKNWFEKLFT